MKVSVSIDVPSLEDGIEFYGKAFGFVESSRPHESYAVLTSGDARIGLLAKPAGSSPAKDCNDVRTYDRHWTPVHIDLNVEDFEMTLQRALDADAKCEQLHRVAGYPHGGLLQRPVRTRLLHHRPTGLRRASIGHRKQRI